jgi:hypothetical protein
MPVDATNPRFTIRTFQQGDEAPILELFERSFHVRRSLEEWRWKFERNPAGREHISVAYDDSGRLVAHYAAYPVPLCDAGREWIAHQVGDTMTERSIRHIGRGPTSILGRTALHFYATFCDRQVAFNYGFNVSNIQRFSMKFLRSDRVEAVPYRVRDLRASPLVPIGRIARRLRGYQLELVHKTSPEWDAFFTQVRSSYGLLTRRDAGYVQWRYLDAPGVGYIVVAVRKWGRMVGWSVFRMRDEEVSWGDALFDPAHAEAIEVMLRHVVPPHAKQRIAGWFPARPAWFARELERLGFIEQPEPQDLSLMCVPFLMADAAEQLRSRAYYTMGDGDLF